MSALFAVGCGTRLPDQAFVRARQGEATSAQQPVAGEPDGGEAVVAVAPGLGEVAPGEEPVDPAAPTPAAGGAAPAAAANKASDVGVTETSIKLGTIVAENGVLGDTFAPAATGMRSWAAAVNAAGGIGGRTVELVTCDDREDRGRTLECARKLVEQDKVFALVGTNTRSMGGAAQYLHDQGIPVLGNPINNSFNRYPRFFSVYGSTFPRDGRTVGIDGKLPSYSTSFRFFKEKFGASPAAVFSYDIAESAQAGDTFQKGLELEGFKVKRYVVSFAAPSFDSAVAEMQRDGTKIIFDSMDEGANRRLCDAMERRGFAAGAKVSTIPLMGESLAKNFGDSCRPVTYVAGSSLPYTEGSNPFVARYRDGMARYQRGKELHQWGLEAWVMGQMVQDYLMASNGSPTRDGFVEHLNSLEDSSPAGIMTPTIGYKPKPQTPTGKHCISVAKWDDGAGRWVLATPFPYCVPDAKRYATPVAEQGN